MTTAHTRVSRQAVTIAGFFIVFLFMLFQALRLVAPFFAPLLGAAVLAIVFFPLHRRIGHWIPRHRGLQAFLSDLAVLILFVLPFGLVLWAAVAQTAAIFPRAEEESARVAQFVRKAPTESFPLLQRLPPSLRHQLDMHSTQIRERLTESARGIVAFLAHKVSTFAQHTFHALVAIGVLLFSLFFFFRDGPNMVASLHRLVPLPTGARERLDDRVRRTVVGVVRGTFLTSLAQGVLCTIGFLIAGTGASILLGVLAAVCSIIPGVGTAIVWIPVSLFLIFTGVTAKGIFLLIWGVAIVAGLEHLLRPWLMGSAGDLPLFWLVFSILGGLEVFGVKGLLLGPLIMGTVAVLFEIYESRFLADEPFVLLDDKCYTGLTRPLVS